MTRTTYKMELFYKHGTPTDIIYDGIHRRFTRTQVYTGKFAYIADFGDTDFIHDGECHIAQHDKDDKLTIWICKERKENKHLHGPGTAILIQPETSHLS